MDSFIPYGPNVEVWEIQYGTNMEFGFGKDKWGSWNTNLQNSVSLFTFSLAILDFGTYMLLVVKRLKKNSSSARRGRCGRV